MASMLALLAATVTGSGTIKFEPPSVAGSEYYATGFQGLAGDAGGPIALGQGESGWIGTKDGGVTWSSFKPDVPTGGEIDVGAVVVSPGRPGMIHNLGSIEAIDKDNKFTELSANNSVWVTFTNGNFSFSLTNKTVTFRGIPEPGISCGSSRHSFGCPFRTGGRGYVTLADGTLVMSIIVWWGTPHSNPNPKLAALSTSIIAFASTDGGFVWDYAGIVLDASQAPMSEEGPNENDLVLLADGKTIMAVIRLDAGDGPLTHPYRPYVITKSSDAGKTWTAMKSLPASVGCARPRLMRTDSGAIVMSGGRQNPKNRDVLLWVNYAGDGELWEEHSITYVHNTLEEDPKLRFTSAVNDSTARETTSYTSLVKTGPESGFIIYAKHLPPSPDVGFAMRFTVSKGSSGKCEGSYTPGTRPGQDFASVKMNGTNPTAYDCQAMCCNEPRCVTWVFVPSGLYPNRPPGTFCWFKAEVISLKGSTCDNGKAGCISGVVNRTLNTMA